MATFDNPAFDSHESVHFFAEAASGLQAIIAIHSSALGPAAGGCRYWQYASSDLALTDALRLSRGMSYKNALADLPMGGGKAVLLKGASAVRREALFAALGRAIDSLGGRYITAEDVGTRIEDMQEVARVTPHVSGLPSTSARAGGDPSPRTAYGVYLAMKESWRFATGSERLAGVRVAVQGVGGVGGALCELLHLDGAQLVIADVSAARAQQVARDYEAKVSTTDALIGTEADILAPCALGGILNARSIEQLRVRVVCGAANNQLASAADGQHLYSRGILYAPDYVVNAGGIISVALEYLHSGSAADAQVRIEKIPLTLRAILEKSAALHAPTSEVADQMAQERIRLAKTSRVDAS
jgi:leucine dehydrogenase